MASAVTSLLAPHRRPSATRKLLHEGCLADPFSSIAFAVLQGWKGIVFHYLGTAQDLVACGAVSEGVLAKPRCATKLDEKGEVVHISRSQGGLLIVGRRREADAPCDLPGCEPWMLKAAREAHDAAKLADEQRRANGAKELLRELEQKSPVLEPQEWLTKHLDRMRSHMEYVALAADSIPAIDRLHHDYRVLETDRNAYMARAMAMSDELAGMLSKLRIVRTAGAKRGLRLVVDNTQVRP